jgi:hypothetical protein
VSVLLAVTGYHKTVTCQLTVQAALCYTQQHNARLRFLHFATNSKEDNAENDSAPLIH